LQSVDLAIERVRIRVQVGGHNIDTEVIRRRYLNGIKNLFSIYLPLADEVMIFDNSKMIPELIAEKSINSDISVLNQPKFNQHQNQYNENI
jgi:predicted ABC-type ATPase